jgi:hypothetical protein
LPDDLSGKVIFTNTVTADDVELLRRRHVAILVTSTPEMDGRSFATNVIEAVVVALSGRRPESLSAADYLDWMQRAGFTPRIERFAPMAQGAVNSVLDPISPRRYTPG